MTILIKNELHPLHADGYRWNGRFMYLHRRLSLFVKVWKFTMGVFFARIRKIRVT